MAGGGWREKEQLVSWVPGEAGSHTQTSRTLPCCKLGSAVRKHPGVGGGGGDPGPAPKLCAQYMSLGTLVALPSIPEAASDQPSRFFFVVVASTTVCPGTVFSVSSTPSRLDFLSLFLCKKSLLKVDL